MYQEQGVNHVTGILLFNFAEREGLQSTSLYFVLRASPASMSSPAVPLGTLSTGPRSHLVLPGNRTLVLRTGFSSDRPLYQIQKTPRLRGYWFLAERESILRLFSTVRSHPSLLLESLIYKCLQSIITCFHPLPFVYDRSIMYVTL